MKNSLLKFTLVAIVAGSLVGAPAYLMAENAPAAGDKPATPPAEKPDQQAGVNKFYGTVSAVDTTAKTFTIDNVTYNVIGETHMTKADDSAATLTDAVVGQPARGTYTKAADGKLNVTKVRFGKKAGGKSGGKSGGKKSDAGGSKADKDAPKDAKDAKETPSDK